MTKKTVRFVMVILMLLVISLYFVSGTYARYTSEFTGDGIANVAKWAVAIKDNGEQHEEEKAFQVTLTSEASDYVVADKIAPSYKVSGDIEVNLSGTEVAVDVIADVDIDSLKTAYEDLGESANNFKASVKLTDSAGNAVDKEISEDESENTTWLIKLPGKTAFTGDNGKVTVTVEVTWDNNDDKNSDTDTVAGTELSELKIPVTLTVQQHIGN